MEGNVAQAYKLTQGHRAVTRGYQEAASASRRQVRSLEGSLDELRAEMQVLAERKEDVAMQLEMMRKKLRSVDSALRHAREETRNAQVLAHVQLSIDLKRTREELERVKVQLRRARENMHSPAIASCIIALTRDFYKRESMKYREIPMTAWYTYNL